METAYSASVIQIPKQEAISDTGATENFVLPGTPVKNVQPARKPISVNIPDGSKIRSTHICNLDIAGIQEKEKHAHIFPGLAHASLIQIIILCDAGCKVNLMKTYVVCTIIEN